MVVIKRSMNITEALNNSDEYLNRCQASMNSDGNITLRNYDRSNKNKDEIIVLSAQETQAIITLFSRLGVIFKNNTLPF